MNQVAIVTGSGKKRVGYHVAKALAKRGYSVAIHYRSSLEEAQETVEEIRSLGVDSHSFQGNLADESEVKRLADEVFHLFGRVDVLVNCAAVWPRKRLEEVTAFDVLRCFETNTLGTFLMCQQFGLRMVQQETGGVIINLGDWAEARPYPAYAAYFPSKAAIPGLTRTFAVELGTRNPKVRVNAILPGPVMLPVDLPPQEKEDAIAATLVQREGQPENIAQAVLSLVENNFITGVCLPVDGGRSIFARGY